MTDKYKPELPKDILEDLLNDYTTKQKLILANKQYSRNGVNLNPKEFLTLDLLDLNLQLHDPVKKSKAIAVMRSRYHAEVFTPAWICNKQINLIDNQYLGYKNAFNTEHDKKWKTSRKKIVFKKGSWSDYVASTRLEITCGEAPYLVSRYDAVSREPIALCDRIGIFDRKMRVIKENVTTKKDWLKWTQLALQSVYGYDFQGDNVFFARRNLLLSYQEYYFDYFSKMPDVKTLKKVAEIICWNIWQMDGIKCVVPFSCESAKQLSLFGNLDKKNKCQACQHDKKSGHVGARCLIMDWNMKKTIEFQQLFAK